MVLGGWSDSSGGPLIPYIQRYYKISYTIVSMLFVGQCIGFLSAGFVNGWLFQRLGLGKVITIGGFIQAVGYVFLIPGFPFPTMPVCYGVIGFGMALQYAGANVYVATLNNAEHKFGYLHAAYGLGGVCCPLAATAFASAGIRFSYFYSISVGLALFSILALLWAFKFNYVLDQESPSVDVSPENVNGEIHLQEISAAAGVGSQSTLPIVSVVQSESVKKKNVLEETLSNWTIWSFSLFALLYVGSEVTQGGWIVSFLLAERGGGPSAGYVATGFWAGIALGRALLPTVNVYFGERRVVYGYLTLSAVLEFAIWFGKNLIGNGVTVALIGFIMGPVFPIIMSLSTKLLPRHLHSSGIGAITAFGQTGSAIFPFATGALSEKYSTNALQPVMLVLFVCQVGLWIFVPSVKKRID
ncbi:MFS general substrate transporter [Meredithblackwellia eburnea MCA 4105]